MPLRNRPLFVHYDAWNLSTNTFVPNDVENHTVIWLKDDTPVVPENDPVEITLDDQHLGYGVWLTADETACYSGTLIVTSTTPNVIIPKIHVLFEQVLGTGAVMVNHDYGGTDNLRYVGPNGSGIENGSIICYLKEDYDAERRSRGFIIAETRTNVDGRWTREMYLTPGDYTLVFFKSGEYSPTVKEITVSAS